MAANDKPKAVVFDTNVFGHGQLDISRLEQWADACALHDAELWIPEVVAWELAEHAVLAASNFDTQVKRHNRFREKWGQGTYPELELPTIDDIVVAIEELGVIVVPLHGPDAVAALRDQVTQSGPGSLKQDIKTGAADSAWIRSVAYHNDRTFDGLVLVSGDSKAVALTADALGLPSPTLISTLRGIAHWLGESTPASPAQAEEFTAAMLVYSQGPELTTDVLTDLADVGLRRNWWQSPIRMGNTWELQDAWFDRIGDIEVDTETATYDGWLSSTSATCAVPVLVETQYARQSPDGGEVLYRAEQYKAWLQGQAEVYSPDPALPAKVRWEEADWTFLVDDDSAEVQDI